MRCNPPHHAPGNAMYLTFALLAAPMVFFMLIWVVVTAYRIYFPEKPLPFEQDPVVRRWRMTSVGHSIPVGVREIRQDQRERLQTTSPTASYHYADGYASEGLPEYWMEDLYLRRN
ncbi:hypothetical protein AWN76_010355 [Rhodothermaceae bacterium RA]|nr:hypothetical protein AWN76_010355 [Rhodothermaceae bacterium RA]